MKRQEEVFVSKCKVWHLKEVDTKVKYRDFVQRRSELRIGADNSIEGFWKEFKDCLLEGANEVCGMTKGPSRQRVSWWWNDECAGVVNEKHRLFVEKENARGLANEKNTANEAYKRAKHEANNR